MPTRLFVRRTRVAAPVERVFRWHELPGAFEKLTPPGEPVRVVSQTGGIQNGGRVELAFGHWPARVHWVAEHSGYIPNRQFRDVQIRGPFRRWEHMHVFEADGPEACYLEDRIEYELPFGRLGARLLAPFVERRLHRLFQYRHLTTREANEHARADLPPAGRVREN